MKLLPSLRSHLHVFHIYQGLTVREPRTHTADKSINIITGLVMWRTNIHSLLTLAAEPSEPRVGAGVQRPGWPFSQGRGLSTERLSRGLHTPHREEGEGCWCGPTPSLCCRKIVKCTLLDRPNPRVWCTNSKHPQWLSVLVASASELRCLSGERAE